MGGDVQLAMSYQDKSNILISNVNPLHRTLLMRKASGVRKLDTTNQFSETYPDTYVYNVNMPDYGISKKYS